MGKGSSRVGGMVDGMGEVQGFLSPAQAEQLSAAMGRSLAGLSEWMERTAEAVSRMTPPPPVITPEAAEKLRVWARSGVDGGR